jgi:hypothetical protein
MVFVENSPCSPKSSKKFAVKIREGSRSLSLLRSRKMVLARSPTYSDDRMWASMFIQSGASTTPRDSALYGLEFKLKRDPRRRTILDH